MPTVPRYQRQVAPQQLPSGALRAVDTPTSAGVGAAQARAQIGRGVQEIGGAVANVGEKFLNIAYSQRAKEMQEAKDYADQLAVLGANNKLSNFERTLYADGGAFTLQGEAAFHLPETVNASFDKTADEIEFGLTNPEQKLAFAKIRAQRGQSIALDLERHVSTEIKQFAVTELQASRDNTTDAAILKGGAGDFTRAGEEMAAHETALRTVAPKLGMGPEAIDEDIRKYRSNIHIGIINQLVADGNVDMARVYFEEVTGKHDYGKRADGSTKGEGFLGILRRPDGMVSSEISIGVEMDGKETEIPTLVPTLTHDEVTQLLTLDLEKDDIPKPIEDKAVAYARERIKAGQSPFAAKGEQATTQYPDLQRAAPQRSEIEGDKLDDVTKLLKEGNTKKQAQQASDKILAEGGTLAEQRAKAKQIENADVRDATLSYIEHEDLVNDRLKRDADEAQSKGIANILDTGRGIKAIPVGTWKDLTDTERTRYRAYAENVANYGQNATKTKPQVLQDLLVMSSTLDPKVREKWLKLDLVKEHMNDLSKSDLEQMLIRQAGDREGKSPDPTIFATESMINEVIDADARKVGLDPSKRTVAQQKRNDAFVTAARDALNREFPPAAGKKPTYPDVRRIVDGLTQAAGTRRSGWFGTEPVYQYEQPPLPMHVTDIKEIPPNEVRKIEQAYRARGKPYPTAQQIIRDFNELRQLSQGQ